MAHERVWVVDDDRSIRWVLERALSQAGFRVECFERARDVLERARDDVPDVVVSDIRMPGINGLEMSSALGEIHPHVPVIITTAHSDLESAVNSYQSGAFEYLPKPFDVDEAVAKVTRAVRARASRGGRGATASVAETDANVTSDIVGKAPAMQEVFRAIGRLARSNITVMIEGASGTGKELVARALHRHSPRGRGAMVALNMAAIPADLIESELFGHERGAFTGAREQRLGRFEQASGGTLFLDEIGDMPGEAQTRLLRVLAEGEFFRVGGRESVKVDVRIITATHRDLRALVVEGRFREDLYHRLNVIRVRVPALAERREDIPLLAELFLANAAREFGGERKVLRADAMALLQSLDWPGNVRQLENTCNWLTVMAPGREVHASDLPPELRTSAVELPASEDDGEGDSWQALLADWAERKLKAGGRAILDEATPAFETAMIRVALKHTRGRRRDAADLLGWGRNTLTRKLAELNIDA